MDSSFLAETAETIRVLPSARTEDFYGYVATKSAVASPIHSPHPARAELSCNFVWT